MKNDIFIKKSWPLTICLLAAVIASSTALAKDQSPVPVLPIINQALQLAGEKNLGELTKLINRIPIAYKSNDVQLGDNPHFVRSFSGGPLVTIDGKFLLTKRMVPWMEIENITSPEKKIEKIIDAWLPSYYGSQIAELLIQKYQLDPENKRATAVAQYLIKTFPRFNEERACTKSMSKSNCVNSIPEVVARLWERETIKLLENAPEIGQKLREQNVQNFAQLYALLKDSDYAKQLPKPQIDINRPAVDMVIATLN